MQAPLGTLEIASAVRMHERTAREVVDHALGRAVELQDRWRAFITLSPDLARRQAEDVDRRVAAGERLPLAGVPFAVKDLFDVAGVPTTAGSRLFNRVPQADATAVRKLTEAGAVLLGKLNLHECAFGFTGENPHYGDCPNPWDPERIAGGSSSGSAVAVATGICPLTLGSDTGGSIRLPAALCGLVGLKPTYGRVSRAGGVPLSWSLDHVGPLVRTAAEAAAALQVLAGPDELDESSSSTAVPDYSAELEKPLEGLKLGVPRNWFFDALDPGVAAALDAAIEELNALGTKRIDVELPHMDEALGAHRAIIFAEASSYYRPFLFGDDGKLSDRAAGLGDDIRPLLLGGLFVPAADYVHAQRVRRIIRDAWSRVFDEIDCLVTPTSPVVATTFGQQQARLPGGVEKPLVRAYLDVTLPFNLSGHPAISVPCGFSGDRLPVGVQLVGRPFDEATILRLAHHYQQATDWHRRLPPLLMKS